MSACSQKFVSILTVLIVIFLAGVVEIIPVRADTQSQLEARVLNQGKCEPDSGWMWTNGSFDADVANQVQQELSKSGISANVEARSYGETDSCGTYSHHGYDFRVQLSTALADNQYSQQTLVDNSIMPVLVKYGKPSLGNVALLSAQGQMIPVANKTQLLSPQSLSVTISAADAITKNVYVLVYDPLLSNGQKLSEYMNWNNYAAITQQTIDFFKQYSNNRVNYTVTNTTVVTSGWPELVDGFSYTEATYMAVWNNPNLHHSPTEVNYNKILSDPGFDICGKLNRGEIDEVWMYGAPWFGFYESTLVGPGSYTFNSPPVSGLYTCEKILPIMGFSIERTVHEAVENFGHRAESAMIKIYGSWAQNDTSHNWNKFTLIDALSPNYSYSGCGNIHYPPNSSLAVEYDYGNSTSVLSNCIDFANYPNLGDPDVVSQPTTCLTWGCYGLGYFGYWFSNMPSNSGCDPNNIANDWWTYIMNPALAIYPSYACQTNMHLISGNVGASYAILSYMDGTLKSVAADSNGNYFLMVSDHWSGTVTPSKSGGYAFTPANRSYTAVQVDMYNQDYTAIVNAPEIDLLGNNVSIVTGDNTPSLVDYTDFGSTLIATGSVSHTFSIVNNGNLNLNLTGSPKVAVSGTNAADFSVSVQPFSPISPAGSTTFTVIFHPSAAGMRTATISIVNNDSDENPYSFSVQGKGSGIYYVNVATGNNGNSCMAVASPCRNIQETINKASAGDVIYVANGTYLFSTNDSPGVVIINKDITLSGGWNPGFTSQTGASIIDGANVNVGLLAVSGNIVVRNFIIQNSTSQNSGAIYIVNGNFTLEKSTLRSNVATSNGGGIFLDNGVLTITNSTISGNHANSSGGGIYAAINSGTSVTIENSTIAYNTASTGGGISQINATYNISNTIIANNSSSVSSPDCSGTIAVAHFNLLENMTGCSILSGNNNLNLDPQLDSNLTENMLVHKLLTGSPAIDVGDNSACATTDQRGAVRPQGAACDLGAYEYDSTITPTLSVTNSPVIYNGSLQSATVIGSVVGIVSNIKYNGSATLPVNAGIYAVTANFVPTDTIKYSSLINASAGNFVINQVKPTVSVTNSPVTYNGSLLSATVTGSVVGTVSNIKYNGSATIPRNVGTYAITANFVPTDTVNYGSLANASVGSFVINKAAPTVSVANSPVTYNGSVQSATVTGSVVGTVSNIKYNGSATVPTNAGTYIITANFVPTDTINYSSLVNVSAGNFVINKATSTISITNSPVTYNGSAQSAIVTSSVVGTVSNNRYNGSATVPTNAGAYAVTVNFTPNDVTNYNTLVNASAGNFVISKATPTLSVTNSPVLYDGASHVATVTGSVPGMVSNILTGGAANQTNAGMYAVTVNFTPTDTANYSNLTNASAGNFVINKVTSTVSVTNSPVTYNGLPQSANVTGSVAGTVSNVKYDGSVTVPTNAASYAVTANFTPNDTTNYSSLTNASTGNFVINQVVPTISVINSPVTYNGSPQSATVTGSVAGTVSNVKYDGSTTVPTNAGMYAITANFEPNDTTNYSSLPNAAVGNFIIDKAVLNVTANNQTITYGNADPTFTFSYSSFKGTDGALAIDTPPTCYISNLHASAGTYPITCAGGADNNYSFSFVEGMLTVNKADPTISVTNSPATYNGSPQTAIVTGSAAGTVNNVKYNGSAIAPTSVGTYTITANFTPNDTTNFNGLTNALAGNFVINKGTPTISVTNSPVTYNGLPQAVTIASSVPGVVNNIKYNSSAIVPTNIGTYVITANFTPTDTINYNSFTNVSAGHFVINQAFFTLTGNAGVGGATLSYTDGTPKTVTADGAGNYSITVPAGWSGTVTPSLNTDAFCPVSQTYTNLLTVRTGQNYAHDACRTFDPISKWTSAFDLSHGWTVASYVRTVGDVNNDGKDDLIGFGQDGVYVALSNGTSFDAISKWTSAFDLSHGWTVASYVRTVGDVNNDGRADLVGFGQDGVYVALSNGTSFDAISKWTSAFDLSHGWTVKDYVRTVGDVNNDGRADLIGFGQDGVYVALSNGTSFGAISKWTSAFDLSHGWTVASYVRTVGDVNNDGRADLIGFGQDGVYVALSNGTSFGAISKWTSAFDLSHGWTVKDYVRTVGDVNNDGRADLIGFGQDGVYISLSMGTTFSLPSRRTTSFDLAHGWTVASYVRTVGDVSGDGKADLVGFGLDGVYVVK